MAFGRYKFGAVTTAQDEDPALPVGFIEDPALPVGFIRV